MGEPMSSAFEVIRGKFDIVGFYAQYLRWENKSGKNWSSLCPFHPEETPSFYVNIENGLWKCQGKCNDGGDPISFLQKQKGYNFEEAVKEVYSYAGEEFKSKPKNETQKKEKKPRYPSLNEETAQKLHEILTQNAREYLNSRGISNEAINKYKIGQYGKYMVFPIRKDGKLHTYKFREVGTKNMWQIKESDLGYNPIWIFPEPDPNREDILICEGEVDCLNALSLGFNATTTTGGAGSWREEWLQYFEGKIVHICYDIDDKGKTGSRKIGQQICHVAKETRIINLDLDPKKYHGGDFNDFFVKEKKSLDEFKVLMKNAEYAVNAHGVNVVEVDGCYCKVETDKKGKEEITEKITNFVIRLNCRYRSQDGNTVRSIRFLSKNGKTSSEFLNIESESMTTKRGFKEFCYSKGDYHFTGSEEDVEDIWKLVSAQDPGKEVFSAFHSGYVAKLGVWLLENCTIKDKTGQVYLPDENGVCWDGNCGYTYKPIEVSSHNIVRCAPSLIVPSGHTDNLIKEFAGKLLLNVSTYDALCALGLVCGSVYYSDILRNFGCFPILWVYGKLQCGKNEFVGFMMRMFGFGRQDCDSIPGIRSPVPITRKLCYYGNIPVWFDEYRNSYQNIEMIKGAFRAAYNGIGRSLGAKESQGIIQERTTAPLIISGEELPQDDALMSRIVITHLKRKDRRDSYYNDVFNLSENCSSHVYNLIKDRSHESTKRLVDIIHNKLNTIKSGIHNLNSRMALNYAIALGCYHEFVGLKTEELEDYVVHGSAIAKQYSSDEEETEATTNNETLDQFFDSVSVLIQKNYFDKISWYKHSKEDDTVAIWFSALYEEWSVQYRKAHGQSPFTNRTIIDLLKEMPYFVESNKVVRIPSTSSMYSNDLRKCIVLRYSRLPEHLKSWFV